MDTKELCPICGEGHVTDHVDQFESEYKGQKAWLTLHYQLCDICTSDFAGTKESKLNKRAVMAFRKSVDGLLTGDEICALRSQYKLTQAQAARLFGGGPVAFSKYENDDVAHSEAMDTLLRLVRRSKVVFWELVDEKNMTQELQPTKTVDEVVKLAQTLGSTLTNVRSMADFRAAAINAGVKTTFAYPADTTEPKKWKM
jgi:HTH-type transcriptional regulator / antitoxin MqsA